MLQATSSKHQSKSSSNKGLGSAESSSYPKPKDDLALSAGEPLTKTSPPEASHLSSSCIPFISSDNSSASASETNNKVAEKCAPEIKESRMQRPRMLTAGSKVVKGQAIERKQKIGGRTSMSEMMRKDTKGVCTGSGSKMGHLAVGVAS